MSFGEMAAKCLFVPPLGQLLGLNSGMGGPVLTLNKLVLTFQNFYLCATFRENWSRNESARM